ncbi:family 16 glycosylhydrolase [Paenibacillus sp. LMG 31458]|uniref:Family 16 glycosylhydrolase n=1 Tax=Paenibacillus phytorum TaxID=2654977 RepID=A0ABX1Y545_9BACL|nr:glycoside hydrolase family 16 protein [Paenibacillus phytorum]NOU75211.1 family 16 glycosylhydrolase [Paenibacillus phytorum]
MKKNWKAIMGTVVSIAVLIACNLQQATAAGFDNSGYQLVFEDEFNGAAGSSMDTSKWDYRYLGPRNDSINTKDAVVLDGSGNLLVKAYTENNTHYTGMIRSKNMWKYGKFEARIKFNTSPGQWSAFWLQSPTYGQIIGDPSNSGVEMDIIEHRNVTSNGTNVSSKGMNNIHWDGYGAYHKSQSSVLWEGDTGTGYHTYAVEWSPTGTNYYFDGVLKWSTLAAVSNVPEYIILSTEVKNNGWAGNIPTGGYGSSSSSTSDMTVDYVRVYQKDLTPPVTTDNAPAGWVNQDTTVTLNAVDDSSVVAATYYTVDGGAQQSGNAITLKTEGVHTLVYWSVDNAGNVEQAHSATVSIDKTAPTVLVSVPVEDGTFENSIDLTPQFTLNDILSGIDDGKTTVTLDTISYTTGDAIPLYKLPLGVHTLVIDSSDLAGNQGSQSVTIRTVASVDSLNALVTRFTDNKWIDNAGVANSLLEKLAENNFYSFVNEVHAQNGKHISSEAATYLLRDAEYVLSKK